MLFGAAHRHKIETERLLIRAPHRRDHAEWTSLREGNRTHLERWEPRWTEHEFSARSFRKRVKWYAEGARRDTSYSFLIFARSDGRMLGGITLDAVRRGTTQRAVLGYWLGEEHTGKGFMAEAVRALVAYGFRDLRLHRIEAASIPENVPSVRVLERTGFEREGYMRSYIRIHGRWEDHLLFAIINPDNADATSQDGADDAEEGAAKAPNKAKVRVA